MKFFNSNFPIVEASMNRASSLELALAVHEAGAFPSLFLLTDDENGKDCKYIRSILDKFRAKTQGLNVVFAIGRHDLTNIELVKLLCEYAPSHIELLPSANNGKVDDVYHFLSEPLIKLALKSLSAKSKLILRLYQPATIDHLTYFDAVYIKGKESAGKIGDWSVKELFLEQKKLTPSLPIIPLGGVGTPDQVSWYLEHGAAAVGVGTVLAACTESPLSTSVKERMIGTTSKDLTFMPDTKQNCLSMGEISETPDWNRDSSLQQGIHGDGKTGLVYLGTAVEYVTQIRTVKETVEYLCSKIQPDYIDN